MEVNQLLILKIAFNIVFVSWQEILPQTETKPGNQTGKCGRTAPVHSEDQGDLTRIRHSQIIVFSHKSRKSPNRNDVRAGLAPFRTFEACWQSRQIGEDIVRMFCRRHAERFCREHFGQGISRDLEIFSESNSW